MGTPTVGPKVRTEIALAFMLSAILQRIGE